MKQRLDLDLSAEKAALCEAIDAWHGRQFTLRFPLAGLHAVKAAAARVAHPMLIDEAASRDMTVERLCTEILARADAAQDAALTLDRDRLALKRDVAAATTGQQLAALRDRVGAS